MTNHTDTSRSGDLVERLRAYPAGPVFQPDGYADVLHLEAADHIEALEAENERLRGVLVDVAASLAAAISLLKRGGKAAKKAAPSDLMFDQMVRDYTGSLERARAALGEKQ